jgi:hypothetical protein
MILFSVLWIPAFYLFWLTIRPENSGSGAFQALLLGVATALFRFFVPVFVRARDFGISRYLSALIDYTSLPVLFPLIAALLIARFYRRSGITDFTGFTLLALAPLTLVCSTVWDAGRREVLRLVITPLLWTALALAVDPLMRLPKRNILYKIAAVLGVTAFSLLPPLVWLYFFSNNLIRGAALLFLSLAPMLIVCAVFFRKKQLSAGQGKTIAKLSMKLKHNAAFAGLVLLCAAALADYLTTDFTRRTFAFKSIDTRQDNVEERMIMLTGSRETDISQYVEELILGPLSPETIPLLDRNARLEALLLREDVVYINLSEEAAIPPAGGSLWDSFAVLRGEIMRNFPFVSEVRIFIAGNEVVSS